MNELLEDNFQNSYDYVHNYFMLIVLDVKKSYMRTQPYYLSLKS